jgi:ElaB/YqjD/DUF883 family membrane-anchored ribosome-binding protein
MGDDPEVIRQQMAETRGALTEKIERLEMAVTEKVQTATTAVTNSVESVKEAVHDTANTVKDTVHDTVNTVKSSVHDSVESVKDALDVPRYFRDYPWAALAVSVAAGFAGGRLLGRRRDPVAQLRSSGRPSFMAAPSPSTNGAGHESPRTPAAPPAAAAPGWTADVAAKYGDELAKLKGVALGAALGLVRDWIGRSTRGDIGDRLSEVIDDVTRKLGGQPFRHNLLDSLSSLGGKPREREASTEARVRDRAAV